MLRNMAIAVITLLGFAAVPTLTARAVKAQPTNNCASELCEGQEGTYCCGLEIPYDCRCVGEGELYCLCHPGPPPTG
jgi:hypothetical protein